MKKFEENVGLNNNSLQNNISNSISINNNQNLQNSFFDDEFILYINDLISSIKHLYKINSLNFNHIKNVFNKTGAFNSNEIIINTNNNVNLVTSFQQIESSFTSFYTNAKEIVRKMKNYHCSKIENNKRNNDKLKISSSDKISQNSYPIYNKIYVKNNINISQNLNRNGLNMKKTDNVNENIRNKFKKIITEKEDLQSSNNSTINLLESYNNHMNYSTQNYSNIYRNTIQNNLQNPLNSDNNIKTIYLSNSLSQRDNENNKKIKLLEEECEKYKKTLNDFSIDIYHFLGTVVNLQNNCIKNLPENLKITFEKEKKILTQKCSSYIANYNQNNIEKYKYNYSIQNLNTESNINENQYEKLKNEFDIINKELFITQRENNELRDEIHFLRKSLNVDNLIKVNTDLKKKEIEFRKISNDKNNETKRNNSNSSMNSINNIYEDGEYKRNYKKKKNENEKMKGIITNLSIEIADMKKKKL